MARLPFHGDHIGSLIRPSTIDSSSIPSIVKKQIDNGIRPLTSGEFDRKYYFSGFFENLTGFEEVSPVPWELARLSAPPIAALKKTGQQYPMAAICKSKIKYDKSPYLENWKRLRDSLPKEQWGECKFTMPPPCYFHLRLAPGKCYSADAYSNDEDFFADLALAYRQEIRTLYDAGLRNLQIDDPTLAYFCSDEMIESLKKDGVDTEAMFSQYLKAHNDCIADKPSDMHIGLHICRGNFSKAMHFSEGSYEKIAERFFKTLNYDTFFLEYDNERSGGFEPLRFLPRDKNVVLGVVTTKDPKLEDKEAIKTKVREAARIVADGQACSVDEAMDRIGISPQCGFASVAIGADGMTEEKMFDKLKLVQEIARELWPA